VQFTERNVGSAVVISPAGRIDMESADAFRAYLLPRVELCARGDEPLVLDFAGIEYISSAGLRVLMLAAKSARSAGGKLAVAALQPLVREIFEISRFDKIIDCYPGVDEAVAAL
jgi:anti-anti-sigma factor